MPEKFEGQICFTRHSLFVRDLRNYSAPLINHTLFIGEGSRPEVCESVGTQNKETIICVRAKLPVGDFGLGGDIRWRDVSIKKFVPGGGVTISREDVVQNFASELGWLLKRDIPDTWAEMRARFGR
jgi:hypothetical protein